MKIRLDRKKINVGIGFVTGRKNFRNVVKSYVFNWNETGLEANKNVALHLFAAYDLKYTKTKVSDYKIIDEEILEIMDSAYYIGDSSIISEIEYLMDKKVVNLKEAKLIFGDGYAKKRNMVLYFAIKSRMDYLIFLDDDEYPVATIKLDGNTVWKGQEVISTHISNMDNVDMTNGYHCGYISPIPQMEFNEKLSEDDFRMFIEAISNDIINWDSIKKKMQDGGVTYADLAITNSPATKVVEEVNGMKFISGANLGFNLRDTKNVFPFYNPPGARGEDTFLSTSITECKVSRVPCYTFHDGFGMYGHLTQGVLPKKLEKMKADAGSNTRRFLKAAIGWVRYKPLLLYITKRETYDSEIAEMKKNLERAIPKICDYFGDKRFHKILDEMDYYDKHVQKHFHDFEETRVVWFKILAFLRKI